MNALHIGAVAVTAAALAGAGTAPARGADIAAGKDKAVLCQTCHGMDGLSKLPDAPHIAGQPEGYLVKALSEYKTGVRKNEMMSVVAAMMTPDDIRNVSAYYSAIEVTVKMPK